MPAIYLTESEVNRLADMPKAIDIVEGAFRGLAEGNADNVPRVRCRAKGIVLHTMPAAAEYLGLVGWKCYTSTRQGARFLMGLASAESGEIVALIEADRLGQLRTGAATGVATRALATQETHHLGLFGTGWQAETQLAAVCAVRPIEEAFVYSRSSERREAFAAKMSEELGISVVPADRPQTAAEDLAIVVTATSSSDPVFAGEWLSEGAMVAAIGSNWPHKAEIDATCVRRADNIVCDDVECCRREAGDFADALEKGVFDWSRAVNLADVVSGRHVGRSTPDSIVLFKSVGMAIEDVALGGHVLERAKAEGMGTPLPF